MLYNHTFRLLGLVIAVAVCRFGNTKIMFSAQNMLAVVVVVACNTLQLGCVCNLLKEM